MRLACHNDPPASCAPMRMQGCLSQRLRRDADSKNGLLMPSRVGLKAGHVGASAAVYKTPIASTAFCSLWSRKRAGKPQRTRFLFVGLVRQVSSASSLLRRSSLHEKAADRRSHWKGFAAPTWYFCDPASTTTHALYFLTRFSSAAHSFPLYFARSMIWNRQSPKLDLENMFKRSFGTKEGRVGKSRPIKTTYREHARKKMQDSLDSPPVGR